VPIGFGGFGPLRYPVARASPWSKDSRYFHGFRQDSRGVKELFVINSLATPRPELEKYKYSMPGEPAIRRTELHVGSRDGKVIARSSRSGRTSRTATSNGTASPASCGSTAPTA